MKFLLFVFILLLQYCIPYLLFQEQPPKIFEKAEVLISKLYEFPPEYESIYHVKYKEANSNTTEIQKVCAVYQRNLEFTEKNVLSLLSFPYSLLLLIEETNNLVILSNNEIFLFKIEDNNFNFVHSKALEGEMNIHAYKMIYSTSSKNVYIFGLNKAISFSAATLENFHIQKNYQLQKTIIDVFYYNQTVLVVAFEEGVTVYKESENELIFQKKIIESETIYDVKISSKFLLFMGRLHGIRFISLENDKYELLENKIPIASGKQFATNDLKTFWIVSDYSDTNLIHEVFYNFEENTYVNNQQFFETSHVKDILFYKDYVIVLGGESNKIFFNSIPKDGHFDFHDFKKIFFEENLMKLEHLNNDYLLGYSQQNVKLYKMDENNPHINCYYKNEVTDFNFTVEIVSKNCKSKKDNNTQDYYSFCLIQQDYQVNISKSIFNNAEIDKIMIILIIIISFCCLVSFILGILGFIKKRNELDLANNMLKNLKIKYKIIDENEKEMVNLSDQG